jgi:hypothetical protein
LACHWLAITIRLPLARHWLAISAPLVCHRLAIGLPSARHWLAIAIGLPSARGPLAIVSPLAHHWLAIGLPSACHQLAISSPSACHQLAVSLTSARHQLAISSTSLQWELTPVVLVVSIKFLGSCWIVIHSIITLTPDSLHGCNCTANRLDPSPIALFQSLITIVWMPIILLPSIGFQCLHLLQGLTHSDSIDSVERTHRRLLANQHSLS